MEYRPHVVITSGTNLHLVDNDCETDNSHANIIPDWQYIYQLYSEYQKIKHKTGAVKQWIYQSSDLTELSYFIPYKQMLDIANDSDGIYGANKWHPDDLDRLARVDSYNLDNYIDVSNVITRTHNWSRISYNFDKLLNTMPQFTDKIKQKLKNYIISDISLFGLACKTPPKSISLFVHCDSNRNTSNNISSSERHIIEKTGTITFCKPSKNKRQVIIWNRDTNTVLMHPMLYHNWHVIIDNKSPTITDINNVFATYVEKNLRIYNCNRLCHFCNSIKGNMFDYYDALCWDCGIKAWKIRNYPGRADQIRACVTGCRHTVGYFTALELLRRGAFVLGTTRFPNIAIETYKQEPDYSDWETRLIIIRADFLNWQDVNELIKALDIYNINTYINNAFQTMPNSQEYIENAVKLDSNPKCLAICLQEPTKDLDSENQITNANYIFLDHNKNIKCSKPMAQFTLNNVSSVMSHCDKDSVSLTQTISNQSNDKQMCSAIVPVKIFGPEPSWKRPICDISPHEIMTAGVINSIVPEMIIGTFRRMHKMKNINKSDGSTSNQIIINVGSSEGFGNVQSSITGGHKNHMIHLINCLRLENDVKLIAYTADPGFITGIYGKKQTPRNEFGIVKALSAHDGAMRIIQPLLEFLTTGKIPNAYYR